MLNKGVTQSQASTVLYSQLLLLELTTLISYCFAWIDSRS